MGEPYKKPLKKPPKASFRQRVFDFYNRQDIVSALSKRWSMRQRMGREVSTLAAVSPRKLAKKVAPFVTGRILDVGIGAGPITKRLIKRPITERIARWFSRRPNSKRGEVVGVDISEKLLKKAKKRGAEPVLADAEALPFKDGSFDSAVCIETLGHIEDPGKVLREMHRTLKPDGQIVVTVPKEFYSGKESSKDVERIGGPPLKVYSETEIKQLVEQSGFEVIKIERAQIAKFPSKLFVYAIKKQMGI